MKNKYYLDFYYGPYIIDLKSNLATAKIAKFNKNNKMFKRFEIIKDDTQIFNSFKKCNKEYQKVVDDFIDNQLNFEAAKELLRQAFYSGIFHKIPDAEQILYNHIDGDLVIESNLDDVLTDKELVRLNYVDKNILPCQ